MGLGHAGSHLLHEVASTGGHEMPINGHHRYPEPTGGTCQSAILPELLWYQPGCQCSVVPRQASGSMAALWTPPTLSYSAMVSSTETTASTSMAGVTPPSHLLPRESAIELMDMLPPLTTENLLATAGVGWGRKPQTPPCIPTAPGPHQTRPKMPQQQAPTPGRQEVTQATPYRQQVFPPKCPAPKPSATPSASQDHGDPAGEAEGARGRSSSRGPQDGQRRSRSSTRGSQKR